MKYRLRTLEEYQAIKQRKGRAYACGNRCASPALFRHNKRTELFAFTRS
jgi:hypothetical protein